jgi:hypothetical protein
MKLHSLVPNFYINVFVNNLYIPTIGPRQTDRGNIYITHRYMNVEIGNEAAQFHLCVGIYFLNSRYNDGVRELEFYFWILTGSSFAVCSLDTACRCAC